MIPYMVGKVAPNSSHLTRGLVKQVSGRVYFRAVFSRNGDETVTSPPPPQSLNRSFAKEAALALVRFLNEGNSYLLRGLAQGSLLCIGMGDVEIVGGSGDVTVAGHWPRHNGCIDSLDHKFIWAVRVEKIESP